MPIVPPRTAGVLVLFEIVVHMVHVRFYDNALNKLTSCTLLIGVWLCVARLPCQYSVGCVSAGSQTREIGRFSARQEAEST